MATNGVEGWPETAWSDQIVWAEPKQHEGIFFLMKIYATSLLNTFILIYWFAVINTQKSF